MSQIKMAGAMSEDDRYRTSSQYRLWSYSSADLYNLRWKTNQFAADRVREAVERVRASRAASVLDSNGNRNGEAADATAEPPVDCLTLEDELKIVKAYCQQLMQLADHLNVSIDVKATAVQFLRRFYLTNSLMTYHPKDMLTTALFFAGKVEHAHFSINRFVAEVKGADADSILASEFLLTQGLRFTFDVRHPYRALEGAIMDLNAMYDGIALNLPGGALVQGWPHDMKNRIQAAHARAYRYLKTSALLTDVYFHFTPSQIMLSAILLSDREIVEFYIKCKIPSSASSLRQKLFSTLETCAAMLDEVDPREGSKASSADKAEVKMLMKKLKNSRNPDKINLVELQRAKREGDGTLDEGKIFKKRKLENEVRAADDMFGPAIKQEPK